MTERQALQILFENAAKNVAGVGCGVRPEESEEKRMLVAQAIKKLWKKAFIHPVSASE